MIAQDACETARVIRPRRLNRSIQRFLTDPESIRTAIWLLTSVTVFATAAGSIVMWTFDHEEYPTFGRALWFTVQTVTTVGYGDVTPERTIGRVVGAVVMVVAIAFSAVITATVTSAFIQGRRRIEGEADRREFEEISGRLNRIEEALRRLAEQPGTPGAQDR